MENTAFSSLLIASAITTNGTMTKSSTPARGGHSAMCPSLPSSSCKGWLLAWRPGSRLVGFYREIEGSNIPISIMPVRLFAIVLALTLAACEKKEVATQGPPGRAGPHGPAGPPGGTVIRFVDGECRQTCTVACEACDVAHRLALLSGIGSKALPSWDSKTRWNNLLGDLAVNVTAGSSGHTNSPHPSSRPQGQHRGSSSGAGTHHRPGRGPTSADAGR